MIRFVRIKEDDREILIDLSEILYIKKDKESGHIYVDFKNGHGVWFDGDKYDAGFSIESGHNLWKYYTKYCEGMVKG